MRTIFYILFLACLCFFGCKQNPEFEGFSKSGKGFYYQLHTLGESGKQLHTGDYVTADISYLTINDSLFFEGRRKIKLSQPAYKGAIEDCFKMLRDDESATFIIQAEPFFSQTLESDLPKFIKTGDLMKIKISIIDIQTNEEFDKQKELFLNWINDFGEFEKVVLQQFLNEEKLSVKPTASGLLYLPIKPGNGIKVEPGDTITIHYEGRFLNGKFFDSTVRRNQPFQFVYGTEWQVIKGLEEALGYMSEGEKAIFIIPSDLAFGQEGSSTGIIPPFTSLIFEVEMISIHKPLRANP